MAGAMRRIDHQIRLVLALLVLIALAVAGSPRQALGRSADRYTTWVARYNDAENDLDTASSVAMSPDGTTVYVAGAAHNCLGDCQYATIAYDAATGSQQWASFYEGGGPPFCREDKAEKVVVSPDGSTVFVTGESCWPVTGYLGYATVAYAADTGDQLWVARFGHGALPVDMAISPDGSRLVVTGYDHGSTYATLAYDTSNGRRLWLARFKGNGFGYTYAYALGLSPDGAQAFVTGVTYTGTRFSYATVAYRTADGGQLWTAEYGGPDPSSIDTAFGLAVSPDGTRVFVTGQSGAPYDYATVAYDATSGDQLWVSRYDEADLTDIARAIGVSPDGSRIYVTGESQGSGTKEDYATVAYDATSGDQFWVSRYDGPKSGADSAVALAVGSNGFLVYVTGSSPGRNTGPDYATIAYNAATGDRSWLLRYDGPASGEDDAVALAVSPEGGNVFVTGNSYGGDTNVDIATEARMP